MAGSPRDSEFLHDALEGLSRSQKSLPGKYLWDEAGSVLFDRICDCADYYISRCETAVLRRHASAIAGIVGPGATLVEFGSGASHKIRVLLDAMIRPRRYVALDISAEYLTAAARRIAEDYPEIDVVPLCADYTKEMSLPLEDDGGPVVGFYPGSTIGNFPPAGVVAFLERALVALGPSRFLVGVDPTCDESVLSQAYGGADGLMAALHRNILVRMRRELGMTVDPEAFRHEVRVFGDPPRVEAHLVARHATDIRLNGRTIAFAAGESIHTDTSYKMDPERFRGLAEKAGWTAEACWVDDGSRFSLHLLRA